MFDDRIKNSIEGAYDDIGLGYISEDTRVISHTPMYFGHVYQFALLGEDDLTFVTLFPEKFDGQFIGDAGRDVLDINPMLRMGAFDLDRECGEVSYRSTILLDGSEPSLDIIRSHIIQGFCSTYDFYRSVWRKYCGSDVDHDLAGSINDCIEVTRGMEDIDQMSFHIMRLLIGKYGTRQEIFDVASTCRVLLLSYDDPMLTDAFVDAIGNFYSISDEQFEELRRIVTT